MHSYLAALGAYWKRGYSIWCDRSDEQGRRKLVQLSWLGELTAITEQVANCEPGCLSDFNFTKQPCGEVWVASRRHSGEIGFDYILRPRRYKGSRR